MKAKILVIVGAIILGSGFASASTANADPLHRKLTNQLSTVPNMPDLPVYSLSSPMYTKAYDSTNSKNGTITRSTILEVREPQAKALDWYKLNMKTKGWVFENWEDESSTITGVMLDKGHICTIQASDADPTDADDTTTINITYRIMKGFK